MLKLETGIAAGMICLGALAAEAPKGIFLGESAEPVKTIYYAQSNRQAAAAANELGEYLERIFAAEFPRRAATDNAGSPGIFVGEELVPQEYRLKDIGPEQEYFTWRVVDGHAYFWGNNLIKSPGISWAVEDFLKRECGVRWLWPGAAGEVVPRLERLRVAVQTRLEKPVFSIREPSFGSSRYSTAAEKTEQRDWYRRMRFGRSIHGYRGTSGFNHYFGHYISPKEFYADHQEYFSLVSPMNWIGGNKPEAPTRTGRPGTSWQLCTANPEVRRIIAQNIIRANTDTIMPISPNDGFSFCECEDCRRLDPARWTNIFKDNPDLSNRIYDFVNAIATEVKKASPKSRIGIFSYSFFSNPPTTIKSLPDNVFISMTYSAGEMGRDEQKKEFADRLEGFGKLGAKFVGREYWGTHYYLNMPWIHTELIDWNVKLINRYGATGLYGEGGKDFANNALNYYLLSELMWNPEASREAVIDDFCRSAFGKGASVMREYFALLEQKAQAWAIGNLKKSYARRLNGFTEMYSPEVIKEAKAKLETAQETAVEPEQKKRVEFFANGLRYAEVMIRMIKTYQQAAAVGPNLIFVEPAGNITEINDDMIRNILKEAIEAGTSREAFVSSLHGTHSVSLGMMLFANQTSLRPWHRIVQDHYHALNKEQYNYLVNGAFEYDLFGWQVSGKPAETDLTDNHDDIHNLTANYHANQGKSLKANLQPGESSILTSTVRVEMKPGSRWMVSGYIHSRGGKMTAQMIWNSDGRETIENLQTIPHGLTDSRGWREFMFEPLTAPEGKKVTAQLRFVLADGTVNLDDLKLMKWR